MNDNLKNLHYGSYNLSCSLPERYRHDVWRKQQLGRINLPTASSAAVVITEAIVTATMMHGMTVSLTMNAIVDTVQTTTRMVGKVSL